MTTIEELTKIGQKIDTFLLSTIDDPQKMVTPKSIQVAELREEIFDLTTQKSDKETLKTKYEELQSLLKHQKYCISPLSQKIASHTQQQTITHYGKFNNIRGARKLTHITQQLLFPQNWVTNIHPVTIQYNTRQNILPNYADGAYYGKNNNLIIISKNIRNKYLLQSTIFHEICHHVEHHNPEIRKLSHAFLQHRKKTTNKFLDARFQVLNEENLGELFSMSSESIFYGTHGNLLGLDGWKPDLELRHFTLGLWNTHNQL